MNTITSRHWNTFPLRKQIQLIEEKFRGYKFVVAFGHPVTSLPGIHTLTMLRTLRIATLEVLENRLSCTVYRIRQTGTVFCSTNENDVLYSDYQQYLISRSESPVLYLFDSKEIVYTIRTEGYVDYIERHKSPRFSGTIEISDNAVLDGPAGKHIDVANINWIDPAPATEKEISSVMKKTILFIRANCAAAKDAKDDTPKQENKNTIYCRVDKPNEQIIFGLSGSGKSQLPQPSNPNLSKEDLRNAAKTLAQYLSPNKVLLDPDTGDVLTRGERKATPDQDTP